MTDRLGLLSQTMFGQPPVEYINLAADTGCTHITTGLGPLPWKLDEFPDWSLRDDLALRRATRAALTERGITISLAEGFAIRPTTDARDRAADLDIFAELGARRAATVSMDLDRGRCADQLAILAEMCAERDMTLLLEFAPPHAFNTLAKALAAVRATRRSNVGVIVDAMHFFRSGGTIDELAAADPALIAYLQICDARIAPGSDDYYAEASFERLRPGEGELPLRDLLRVVPPDVPIGIEVPMRTEIEASGFEPAIRRIVAASRKLVKTEGG